MKITTLTLLLLLSFVPVYGVLAENADIAPKVVPTSEDGVQRIDIVVDSYSYNPAHIIVSADKPVELNLRSVTSIVPHNFVIDDPESGIEIKETVSSGKDLKISFTPGQTGTFKFYCSKSGIFGSHLDKGMEGTIQVVE
jgi:plastocyanin